MNKICYGDSSLWLCVRVAQAGQPAANCVSEHPHGPPAHSQLDLTEPRSLHLKVWVRLGTSSLLVCILAGRLLCHFLTDGIFRGATQLGKVICRFSILGTQKLSKSQLIWTIKSLQQPGVWVPGLQREARICCHDHRFWGLKFVLVDKRDPLFLSLVLTVYSPRELKQNEGTPYLSPSPDQRWGALPGLLRATLLALAKGGIQHTTAHSVPS